MRGWLGAWVIALSVSAGGSPLSAQEETLETCQAACTAQREQCCARSSPCSTGCADANRYCELDCARRFPGGPVPGS